MEQQSWPKRHWKVILNVVTLLAFALLVYATRKELSQTLRHLSHVNWWVVLLLFPIEAINYHAQARLYQRLFAIVGNRLTYGYLYRASLELNFVNHVFPSGGVTGLSYFSLRLREGEKLTGTKATLVHFMKIALMFLSFEAMLLFGVLALTAMNRVNNVVLVVAGSLSTLLIVGTIGFGYMLQKKSRIHGFFSSLTRGINKLMHVLRRRTDAISVAQAEKIVDDFHDNYLQIKSHYRELKGPLWFGLLCNLTEVGAVYLVFVAFGHWVNVGAIILAYAVANFAGLVSVLPGGVGIYEALMATVLAGTGIPAGESLPIIIVYRLANTIIQVPLGYVLYLDTIRRGGPKPQELANA